MKKTCLLLLLTLSGPAWAGTLLQAHLESPTDPDAWVDLTASISQGLLRLDAVGPKAHGALIYDEKTSLLTLVDDLHKTLYPLTSTDQSTLKFLGAMGAERIEAEILKGKPEDQRLYQLVKRNAKAFFNGKPLLKQRGVRQGSFTCDIYRLEVNRKKIREVGMVPPDKAGVDRADYKSFLGLANLLLDVCGGELFQLGAESEVFRRRFSSSLMPVQAVIYEEGRPSGRFQVLTIRSGNFRTGTFDPPAEYQVKSLLGMIQQGMGRGK